MSNQTEALERLCGARLFGVGDSIPASLNPRREGLPETNPASVFRPVDIGDLLAQPEEVIPWVVDGYLARGRITLLGGSPKVGKTTLAHSLMLHTLTGQPILNRVVWQAKGLILALEEHAQDVAQRFRDSGIAVAGSLKVWTGPLPFTQEVLYEIVAYIEQEEIGLVLVDTLPTWLEVKDENSAAEMLRAGKMLLGAARHTAAAWLCLVHSRKSGGEHGEEIRGSSALVGIVDISLTLKRTEGGDPQRCLDAATRYAETPTKLIIGLGEKGYEALGSPQEVYAEGKARKLRAAMTGQGQTVKDLAAATGLSQRDVQRSLTHLGVPPVREGAGKKHDPYRYRLDSILATPHSREGSLPETNQPESEEVLTDAD